MFNIGPWEFEEALKDEQPPIKTFSNEAPVEKKEDLSLNMANSFDSTMEKKEEVIQTEMSSELK